MDLLIGSKNVLSNETWFGRVNVGSVQRILSDTMHRKWFIRVYQVALADPGIFLLKAKVLPYDSQAQYVSDLWVIDRLK